MLNMSGPSWKLEDDYKTLTATFPTEPPVALRLDVAAVEDLLKHLGEFRALMRPEVQPKLLTGTKAEAIVDTAWVTEPEMLMGASLLHLRDKRYGWLHYLIPRAEAQKLGDALQKQAAAPPPGPTGKPN
jgi:hypothetical protein